MPAALIHLPGVQKIKKNCVNHGSMAIRIGGLKQASIEVGNG